jgi:hypothetical protein
MKLLTSVTGMMIINNQNNITETIKAKIQAGNTAYYSNLHLLKNRTISRKAKINIYKTLIRPVVTYGSEVWILTKKKKTTCFTCI